MLPVLLFCGTAFLCAGQQTDTANRKKDTLVAATEQMISVDSMAQTAEPIKGTKVDSVIRQHSPRKAAIRSAIIPGWGQVYNKKYWKLPLVYGALGTTAGIFVFNVSNYRQFRFAYQAKFKAALPPRDPNNPNQTGPFRDSTDYFKISPELLSYSQNGLRQLRDGYRRNVDYSVLFFLLFWGLNVVDATVDAHLKAFDVSPDLGLKFRAGYSELARTNTVGLVLTFK